MRRSRRHAAARSGRRVLLVVAVLVLGCVTVAGLAWSGGRSDAGDVRPVRERQLALPSSDSRWEEVLVGLLARRARAYAAGEPARLLGVYPPGSEVLHRDRAVLRAWAQRDLTVERASVRLRTVAVARHTRGSVVLRTIDRLGPAIAVGPTGVTRALPRDRPSAHRIVLAPTADGWRIATIRALSG